METVKPNLDPYEGTFGPGHTLEQHVRNLDYAFQRIVDRLGVLEAGRRGGIDADKGTVDLALFHEQWARTERLADRVREIKAAIREHRSRVLGGSWGAPDRARADADSALWRALDD